MQVLGEERFKSNMEVRYQKLQNRNLELHGVGVVINKSLSIYTVKIAQISHRFSLRTNAYVIQVSQKSIVFSFQKYLNLQ